MKKRSDLLLLLPSLCGFTAFYIVPFLYSLYYAFTENAFSDRFVGLGNFKMLLENEYFRIDEDRSGMLDLILREVCHKDYYIQHRIQRIRNAKRRVSLLALSH